MSKNHWWENLQRQCRSCRRYLAEEFVEERWTENNRFLVFLCKFCGITREKEGAFAIYEARNGKSFLRRNGWKDFKEVELNQLGNYIKIREIDRNRFSRIF